jgi:hypothetical protein
MQFVDEHNISEASEECKSDFDMQNRMFAGREN